MPHSKQFSRAAFNRCLRSFLSAASVKLEAEAKAVFAGLGEATISAGAGAEDKLALACVRMAVKKLAEQQTKLEELSR